MKFHVPKFLASMFRCQKNNQDVVNFCKSFIERRMTDSKDIPPIYVVFWHKNDPSARFRDINKLKNYCKERNWSMYGQ